MEKNIVDKKLVELLESYDYEFMGEFTFVFDFKRSKYSYLTIKMLPNGSEKCAYCIRLDYDGDSGKAGFEVETEYSIMEYELDFFSQIAEDKKKIMAMYNEVA